MAGDRAHRPTAHPLSAALACVLCIGLLAGVAFADPRGIDRFTQQARRVFFGERGTSGDPDGEGASGSRSERCGAVVRSIRLARPPADDPDAVVGAIVVIQRACGDDQRAVPLLAELRRRLAAGG